jgi:subtilase-type serine protease
MYAFSGADSARSPLSPSFQRARRKLLSFVSAAAIAIALPAVPSLAQEAGKYFMADGTKTDDLDTAMQSWRDDPEFKGTWGFAAINAEAAFARGITGKGVTIGLLDSGTKVSHPEFKDKNIKVLSFTGTYADGTPFDIRGDDPKDGHGTKMAGLLGAARDHTGMMGLAYGAGLVIGSTGLDDSHDLEYATRPYEYFKLVQEGLVKSGVRIISNSWGQAPGVTGGLDYLNGFYSRAPKPSYLDAMADAANAGLIQVVAGYNERTANPAITPILPHYRPELEKNWIAVANLNAPEELGSSNKCGAAKYWCISAPGDGSKSTSLDDGYTSAGGTSSATPHASATLALLMQRFPGLGNDEIRQIMLTTATDIGDAGVDAKFGWGRIDIAKAMNGPAQFLSRFNANLGEGVSDTWSNDITQVALDQRRQEEQQEITDWATRKAALGLNDGIPANLVETLAGTLVNDVPEGKKLLKAAIAANIQEKYTAEKLQTALAAARANPAGSALLALYEKSHPGWASGWSTETDYTNFIASYTDDRAIAGVIAQPAAEGVKSEFASTETRTAYLATKTYDAGITKSGEGSLTLAGKNTWRGDTIVDGGQLAIAEGGSIISNTFVNDTGEFTVDGTAANATINKGGQFKVGETGTVGDMTFNGGWGIINGKGGNASVNGGSLTIGDGGTAGDLVLNGGMSAVYGMAGNATVNADGELGGKGGSVASLVVNRDGLVSPAGQFHTQEQDDGLVKSWPPHGTEIGVLTVTGDATFHPGSLLNIGIMWDASGADLLKVGGTATLLGGVVSVRLENNMAILSQKAIESFCLDNDYEILNAGKGVEGRFESVLPQYNYVTAELDYSDANKVTLGFGLTNAGRDEQDRLAREEALRLLKERVKNLVLIDATTKNQIAVGGAIKSLELDNRLLTTVLFSEIGSDSLNYDGLSGEVHATLAGMLSKDAGYVSDAAQNRLRAAFDGVAAKPQVTAAPLSFAPAQRANTSDAFASITPAPATTALWGEAYGSWAHADGDGNAAGYSRNIGGFVTGLDGMVADTWRMGVLAAYGNTSLDSGASHASVDSYSVGLYGGTAWDNLRLSLGTALTQNEIGTHRTAAFGDLVNRHSASYGAKTVQVFGELGYAVKTAYADFEPFAAASYVHLRSGGFQENGEISNLTGLAGTSDLTTTTLGLRVSHDFAYGDTISLTARGLLGWSHAFGDVTPEAKLAFAGGQPFAVEGLPVARDTGIVEAGFDFTLSPSKGEFGNSTTLGLTYKGQFSSQAHDNAVKADLTVRF